MRQEDLAPGVQAAEDRDADEGDERVLRDRLGGHDGERHPAGARRQGVEWRPAPGQAPERGRRVPAARAAPRSGG